MTSPVNREEFCFHAHSPVFRFEGFFCELPLVDHEFVFCPSVHVSVAAGQNGLQLKKSLHDFRDLYIAELVTMWSKTVLGEKFEFLK